MNCNDIQKHGEAPCYLVKCPKALQWFHNGQLYKHSDEERQAGRFELFLDLLYIAIAANFSEELAEHPDGAHLAKYVLIFVPAWHIWSDLREIMNSYYTDDLAQRLVVLWVMALMVLYSNNAASADEDIWAMRTAVGAYMVARFTVACAFIVTSFASYHHRVQARIMAGFMFVGLIIIVPLLVDEDRVSLRAKCGVIAAALVYQEATWALTLSPWLKRRLRLTYSTAVDLAHEVDRLAAFFIIILGEFVLTIVLHNPAGTGISLGYLKAFCTLVVAFSLNWVYASGDGGGARSTHPIRHSAWTAFAFFLLHLPMSAAFLIGGHVAAISTELDEFEPGHRWLLGGGLGVGMFCMWVYGMIFHGGPADAVLFMPQYLRVGARLVIAIVLIVMPLSHNHLGTTEFMIVVMCLFAFLLVWETVAGLSKSARVFEPWTHCHPPPDDAPSSHDEEARSD